MRIEARLVPSRSCQVRSSTNILDSTSADARNWFVDKLQGMRQTYGIDSFKFDAGEVIWLTRCFKLASAVYPNQYSTDYVDMASRLGGMIEVRSGSSNQHNPIFFRIMDKDSVWGENNGLKALINVALTMSTIGYPFQLPDMIGGNAYNQQYPDREIFIRWTQANTFLPAMQFSIAPWDYDDNQVIVDVAKQAVAIHESIDWESLAAQSVKSGLPIIRPLWYFDESESALTRSDEFLVGDGILVAPILDEGATERSVFLPSGTWVYQGKTNFGSVFTGPTTITVSVPLDEFCYFSRQ